MKPKILIREETAQPNFTSLGAPVPQQNILDSIFCYATSISVKRQYVYGSQSAFWMISFGTSGFRSIYLRPEENQMPDLTYKEGVDMDDCQSKLSSKRGLPDRDQLMWRDVLVWTSCLIHSLNEILAFQVDFLLMAGRAQQLAIGRRAISLTPKTDFRLRSIFSLHLPSIKRDQF